MSSEYDDVEAGGRYELAEEIILAAVTAGRFRLLARKALDRPRNSVFLETVELSEVSVDTIRQGTFDRSDGEIILFPADDDQSEFVDLHLYADEVANATRELEAYRQGGDPADDETGSEREQEGSEKQTVGAETRCAEWFRQRIADVANDDQITGKGAWLREARRHFPGLPKRAFHRIWEKHAPNSWKRAGRKPARLERTASGSAEN